MTYSLWGGRSGAGGYVASGSRGVGGQFVNILFFLYTLDPML